MKLRLMAQVFDFKRIPKRPRPLKPRIFIRIYADNRKAVIARPNFLVRLAQIVDYDAFNATHIRQRLDRPFRMIKPNIRINFAHRLTKRLIKRSRLAVAYYASSTEYFVRCRYFLGKMRKYFVRITL